MDLSTFEHSETATVKIRDPFGAWTDIEVEVYGRDSQVYRRAVAEARKQAADKDDEKAQAENGARIIQSCIKGWKNVQFKGKAIKPNTAAALKLLADPDYDWFNIQLLNAIQNRALFFTKSGSD